ncbi:MAG: hypothetical protein [Wendovervirus sonii]|uniref:Nucleoside triphosphate pyrophosphohydrolase n=1 Tax=phage Lak_Megaphage_Sonny TaxID=3109229 RepID=A0ABZ0Z6K6_9CAUD|nr:MAG: hypothetical protein [phage Lak_Megaphage_Sonny]
MNKKQLYESVMKIVSCEVKKALNENCITPAQKALTSDVLHIISNEIDWREEDEKIEYTNALTDEDSIEYQNVINILLSDDYGYSYNDITGAVESIIYDCALAMQRFDFDEDKSRDYFKC